MMMVRLEQQEWNQLIAMLATQPWQQANPIIMKVAAQLQAQGAGQTAPGRGNGPDPLPEDFPGREGRQRPS